MPINNFNIKGLTTAEVNTSRAENGWNSPVLKKENGLLEALKSLAKEPMVVLLLVAAIIYFVSGKTGDGIFLALAIVLVATISLYQDSRSRNALEKLRAYTEPHCTVIRDGHAVEIKSEDIVVGDSLVVAEGKLITADGIIIQANDFSVVEAVLTGEPFPVYKNQDMEDNLVFQGTTVTSGLAIARVTAVGNETKLGRIGKSLESIKEEKTPLERQINNFIEKMVIAGAMIFAVVWAINYLHSFNFLDSLLKALTLAMSILPEEIPVAFTTFMALGAWRLMRMGVVVKQMKTVETLGSATVICTDKTGTITENKMCLTRLFLPGGNSVLDAEGELGDEGRRLVRMAMWASEPIPFDPMEVALHEAYKNSALNDERADYQMVHEYPLAGKPPMMTHVFENAAGLRIVAAKGAPEALMAVSGLSAPEKEAVEVAVAQLAVKGLRVLGVGTAAFDGIVFPKQQQELPFKFEGLVAFYDPPKKNIAVVLADFYKAGIAVKIVTGDNAETTLAIAKQIGLKGFDKSMTGDGLMLLKEDELQQAVWDTNVFSRMFPEAKLKIINALKARNEIVAMTGDGVNDGPALKAAHIGVAMGKKGTEIARDAASLILLEDDLAGMVDAVAMGRRIYTNLKKAIQYIISIHIPIVLTVFVPLVLRWIYPNLFSPVHIIFLELVMGPTCSIVYENEPMEENTMLQPPRPFTSTFFSWKELFTSIVQGLMITLGALMVYCMGVAMGYNEPVTRTMVFTVLIAANIVLTLVNRSFYFSVLSTLRYKNNLVVLIVGITVGIMALLLFVKPLTDFFYFERLNMLQLGFSIVVGFLSVIWFELVKWYKRSAF